MRSSLRILGATALLLATLPQLSTQSSFAAPADAACVTVNVTDTLTASSSIIGNECVISFTSGTGNWTAPDGLVSASLLIIGGGGGGGAAFDNAGGGGGGAGLVTYQSSFALSGGATYSISIGAGGAAGVGSSGTPRETVGGNGGDSVINASNGSELIRTFGGNGGSGSRTLNSGNSGTSKAGGAAATSSSGAKGGNSGNGGGGGGGGGGNASAGGSGGAGSAGSAGTGVSYTIRNNSSVTYGTGGAGGANLVTSGVFTNGTSATTAGSGGSGGNSGSSSQASGGAGASGLVVLRYLLPAETTSFQLSTGLATAYFRSPSTINVTMNQDAKVTFSADGKRLPGCISIRPTGSSSTWNLSCAWKPSRRGLIKISILAVPLATGMTATANLNLQVVQGSSLR